MSANDRYYVLWDRSEPCDRPLADEHLKGFANSFVQKNRRARWRQLLDKRGKKLFAESHSLERALDQAYCQKVDGVDRLDLGAQGVYYDFLDEPRLVKSKDAVEMGVDRDAVFSVVAGRKAVLFSHEGRAWLCQK